MKKIITLVSMLTCGIVISNAQITITSADVVTIGKVIYQCTDSVKSTVKAGLDPGPSGANKIWNFSSLLSNAIDTLTITNPNWLPHGSSFPTSNLAAQFTNGMEYYLKNSSSGLYAVGAYANFTGQGNSTIQISPNEELTSFPNTYNSSFQNTSGTEFKASFTQFPGYDSLHYKEVKNTNSLTDGWGSITTPMATKNCIRQRAKVNTIDSSWVRSSITHQWTLVNSSKDSSWHFSWWANGVGLALLECDSTAGDTIRSINWLKTAPVIGGVHEYSALSGVSTYPNPSSGNINISVPAAVKEYTAEIYTALGEKVSTSSFAGNKESVVDLNTLPNGIYFLRITSKEGTITRKLVVRR